MASWDSPADAATRALGPATITTPQGMRAYHCATVNPALFISSTASAILYNNYNRDAPVNDKSQVCNYCLCTGAFCAQIQARVSYDPEDNAVVLLNSSCVDCYA
jgi:hypothetical protein